MASRNATNKDKLTDVDAVIFVRLSPKHAAAVYRPLLIALSKAAITSARFN